MIFTAPGRFESAPVVGNIVVAAAAGAAAPVVENMEAAAVAGGAEGGDSDLESVPVVENVEVAAAARGGRGGGSRGSIVLVPRSERRSDHRGMASVTTIIGGRKRNAMGGPI